MTMNDTNGWAQQGAPTAGPASATGVLASEAAVATLEAPQLPLSLLPVGDRGLIVAVEGEGDEVDRIKQLGLCVGRRVGMLRSGDPMVVEVLGSKFAMQAPLADRVRVTACCGHPETAEPGAAAQAALSPRSTMSLPVIKLGPRDPVIAIVGNPNAGKTTLFNAMTGLRARTSNFAGTTVEHRHGRTKVGKHSVELLDLPGMYSLQARNPEEVVAKQVLMGELPGGTRPDAVVLVLDATNLCRNLFLASQVIELGIPTIIALTMADLATRREIRIDLKMLHMQLGCPVVAVSVPKRMGMDHLSHELEKLLTRAAPEAASAEGAASCGNDAPGAEACGTCSGCPFTKAYDWAEKVGAACVKEPARKVGLWTDKVDQVLTHPVLGLLTFAAVMFGVFVSIFWLASYPMDWIDGFFGWLGGAVASAMPESLLRSLLVEGVIGGVGGMLVFLPQICILFFALTLLEDTGYLARVALVMDRMMKHVGLPGKAFVPLLTAHACAIPSIMASRVVEDPRDRLVTILVAPLLTCSARLPVYAMVAWLMFGDEPIKSAALFVVSYAIGIMAALSCAWVFKRILQRGRITPLLIELPAFKVPHLRNALLCTYDRGWVFVKTAGTVILLISVVLWVTATFPRVDAPPEAVQMRAQAEQLAATDAQAAEALAQEADHAESQHALSQSIAGRLGSAIEPVIRPLGFDDRIGVGIISSFAAREVVVATLSILYGVGEDGAEETDSLYATLRESTRPDGTPVFTAATCMSLLVFYILAMQCLPTNIVTRRETGSWKWPAIQFGYMTVLAYVASLITYQAATAMGL